MIRSSTQSADVQKQVFSEVPKLTVEMKQGDNAGSGKEKTEFYKPITEYKAVLDLGELTNNKSGFRDWKIRMKDALVQVLRGREFLKIMDWTESTST